MTLGSGFTRPLRILGVTMALGASAIVDGVRVGYVLMSDLPGVGPALRQGADSLAQYGARIIDQAADPGMRDLRSVVIQAMSSIVDDIDLTALIRDRIDLDLLIESIDVDALVARLDVATVVDKLDLDAVVEQLVIDSIVQRLDIPAVVDRLDLDGIVARLDMDELVERLDIDSIVRRIDLIAVLSGMVERMKLPTVLRDSLRMRAADADARPRSRSARPAVPDIPAVTDGRD